MLGGNAGPRNISPKELARQWRALPNKFEVNLWNFEIKAGKAAVEVFRESFNLHRFNSSGSIPWKERTRPKSHPILYETGSLKQSIKWKHDGAKGSSKGVKIYTDPKGFSKAARNKGFCYAAVHNAKSGTYQYGRSGVPSVQRQFMGHSTVLEQKLKELSSVIFHGFPK